MRRLESYIIKNFLSFFAPFFLTLFSISSLVLIIRLADLTGVVSVDFSEFLSLYMFGVPQLLFYTLPIAFFLSMGLSFAKLSFDRELVAIFALGAGVKALLSPVVKLSAALSAALLFIGYFAAPYSSTTAKNFVESKKNLSKLNIKPSEAGQKFGDWLLFAIDKNDTEIVGATLFSASKKSSLLDGDADKNATSTFLSAQSARIADQNGSPALILKNGKGYRIEEDNSTKLLKFEELIIGSPPLKSEFAPSNFFGYWSEALSDKKRAKDFCDVLLTSLFPILSIFFIPAFGIINPRYQKNRAALYFIASIALFYSVMLAANPAFTFFGAAAIAFLWPLVGYALYKKSVAVRF